MLLKNEITVQLDSAIFQQSRKQILQVVVSVDVDFYSNEKETFFNTFSLKKLGCFTKTYETQLN